MIIKNAINGKDIEIINDIIVRIEENLHSATCIDASGLTVLPGFIETHTHGAIGVDFNDVTIEKIEKVCTFYLNHGVAAFLPTILSDTKEKLLELVKIWNKARKEIKVGAKILGIHLEGPFLSKEFKGAMPESCLRNPSIDEFFEYQANSDNIIKMITVAPELNGMQNFIKVVNKTGVVVSMGHTSADYETAMTAIENGVKCSTHTWNAMKLSTQREPAVLGAIFESDIYAELICDGLHVHKTNILNSIKLKGIDKILAVTDSISATGLPDGKYKLGINEIIVKNGNATLKDGVTKAGSVLCPDECFKNLVEWTGLSPQEAIKMMSENQARLLNIFDTYGSIEVGKNGYLLVSSPTGKISHIDNIL